MFVHAQDVRILTIILILRWEGKNLKKYVIIWKIVATAQKITVQKNIAHVLEKEKPAENNAIVNNVKIYET